jgi:hypothetical protein
MYGALEKGGPADYVANTVALDCPVRQFFMGAPMPGAKFSQRIRESSKTASRAELADFASGSLIEATARNSGWDDCSISKQQLTSMVAIGCT